MEPANVATSRDTEETGVLATAVQCFNVSSSTDTVEIAAKFRGSWSSRSCPARERTRTFVPLFRRHNALELCANSRGKGSKKKKRSESARSHDRSGGKEKPSRLEVESLEESVSPRSWRPGKLESERKSLGTTLTDVVCAAVSLWGKPPRSATLKNRVLYKQ